MENNYGCNKRLEAIEKKIEELISLLKGKDKDGGLITEVVILKKTVDELPTPNALKFYASVGGGVVMVLAILGCIVMKVFGK